MLFAAGIGKGRSKERKRRKNYKMAAEKDEASAALLARKSVNTVR